MADLKNDPSVIADKIDYSGIPDWLDPLNFNSAS